MPLNMNTIGTGTGIGGGSGSGGITDTLLDMNDYISSRVHSVSMSSFDISNTPIYEEWVGREGYGNPPSSSEYYRYVHPLITYKDELYVYLADSKVQVLSSVTNFQDKLYKAKIQDNGEMTLTAITIPFLQIFSAFVFNNVMYLATNTVYNESNSFDSMYSFNGTTFTKLAIDKLITNLYNTMKTSLTSSYIELGMRVTPILNAESNDCILVVGKLIGTYNSGTTYPYYTELAIWTLSRSGVITETLAPGAVQHDYNITTFQNIDYNGNRNVRGKILLGFCRSNFSQVNPDQYGNMCTSYTFTPSTKIHLINLTTTYIDYSSDTGAAKLMVYKMKLTFTYNDKTSKYAIGFTEVSNAQLATKKLTCYSGQTFMTNYDHRWFPLSYSRLDTFVFLLHDGYYTDYGNRGSRYSGSTILDQNSTPRLWLAKINGDEITFSSLSMKYTEYQLDADSAISGLSVIDLNNYKPGFHVFRHYTTDGAYHYYRYKVYPINMSNASYSSDDSTYTVELYLDTGDECICGAGIIRVVVGGTTASINNKTYKAKTAGKHVFTCKVYDAYKRPEFIVKSKNGNLLNLRIKYDKENSQISGYFQKGMSVNGTTVTDSGYNVIKISNPRISIKME